MRELKNSRFGLLFVMENFVCLCSSFHVPCTRESPVPIPSGCAHSLLFCTENFCLLICSVVSFQLCATTGLLSKPLLQFFGFEPTLLTLHSWSSPPVIILLIFCLIIISWGYFLQHECIHMTDDCVSLI